MASSHMSDMWCALCSVCSIPAADLSTGVNASMIDLGRHLPSWELNFARLAIRVLVHLLPNAEGRSSVKIGWRDTAGRDFEALAEADAI